LHNLKDVDACMGLGVEPSPRHVAPDSPADPSPERARSLWLARLMVGHGRGAAARRHVWCFRSPRRRPRCLASSSAVQGRVRWPAENAIGSWHV
jgi:hypothetical protein